MIMNFQQSKVDQLNYELTQTQNYLIALIERLESEDYYGDEDLEWECEDILDKIDEGATLSEEEDEDV